MTRGSLNEEESAGSKDDENRDLIEDAALSLLFSR